ncbi:hypothetical protein V2A60_008933 [Cordyceps javanica]|uniref:Suppressor of fused protein (SUFU) domain-containing protein n=1 Tax=Cordyceps javanica TaxID=43265 RepID=A0A545VN63_9HYPO|nr:suppressor of fused protein (SUFU) domain-containing protein [Cordyceps javanica]TQW03163.1 suppressor of fused protein (SUFU) domain-containing protein [Cordyceps javanica]
MPFTSSDGGAGWDAITSALDALYPGQEPKHYGTLIGWRLGGPDPLDGISVWKRAEPVPHWHYVTYGLTNLSSPTSPDAAAAAGRSGYGFELTFRLACAAEDDEPPMWAINFLQNLARYVFGSGNVFKEGDWMSANGPLATDEATQLCSLAIVRDPELPAAGLATPNGRVSFLQVVGLTQDEEDAAKSWATRKLLDAMRPHMPLWVTDLRRASLLRRPDVEAALAEGMRRDGSSSGSLFADVLSWSAQQQQEQQQQEEEEEEGGPSSASSSAAAAADADPKPPLQTAPRSITTITMGALQMEGLLALLPRRLPHGRGVSLDGRDQSVQFEPADVDRVTSDGGRLRLQLAPPTVEALLRTLRAKAGDYHVLPGLPDVRWTVEVTRIRDGQGNVTSTVG